MATTLNSIDLGDIQNESQEKIAALFEQPLPGSDSDKSILLDLFGVNKVVTITGIINGDRATLRSFINSIYALENGRQSPVSFQSGLLTGTINVLIDNFSWDWKKGSPRVLEYTLTLKEGSS